VEHPQEEVLSQDDPAALAPPDLSRPAPDLVVTRHQPQRIVKDASHSVTINLVRKQHVGRTVEYASITT
jgi:hypothetical protein